MNFGKQDTQNKGIIGHYTVNLDIRQNIAAHKYEWLIF